MNWILHYFGISCDKAWAGPCGKAAALFVIAAKEEHIAIKEANRLGIPVVAVVDTNSSTDGVDYVIPGNDDAIRAISFYCNTIADVISKARAPIIAEEAKSVAAKAVMKKRAVKKSADSAAPASPATSEQDAAAPKATVKTVRKVAATTTDADAKAEAASKPKAKAKTKAKAKAKVKTVAKDAATEAKSDTDSDVAGDKQQDKE